MKTGDFPHKDVFELVSSRTQKGMFKSNAERERVARIWAEFISPWFGYPSNWIADELRESYKGDESSCTVKCKICEAIKVVIVTISLSFFSHSYPCPF
jgi:hypothetical protein